MALTTPPAFVGKITISSLNNKLYWREDAAFDHAITITSGTYWPDDLATTLASAMDAASLATGAVNTYTWTFDVTTGLATCARATGSAGFYLKSTIFETANILRGGDNDSFAGALGTGQWGLNSLGWAVEAAYPSFAATVTSANPHAHWWSDDQPPQAQDDGNEFISTYAQAFAVDGTPTSYDFTGWEIDKDETIYGSLSRTWTLSWQFVTTAQKASWINNFWGPYGKTGASFRFYPDRSVATYYPHILTGDSLRNHGFSSRQQGYLWWSGTINMHRVAS